MTSEQFQYDHIGVGDKLISKLGTLYPQGEWQWQVRSYKIEVTHHLEQFYQNPFETRT